MPPLAQTLRSTSPKGFEAVENKPMSAPVVVPGHTLGGNPYIRCPLPPFNAGPDTLRQFNENGKTPTRRVIPLPESTMNGGGGSVSNTTIIQQGGSGSSTAPKLISASVAIAVPPLAPGEAFMAFAAAAKSYQLLQLSSTEALEVRLYADAATQGADTPRDTDTAVPYEVVPGVITDVVFDTAPYVWNWQNRIGANADGPQTLNLYISVINPSDLTGTSNAVVTVTFLPLES